MNNDIEEAHNLLEQLQAEVEKVQELYDRYNELADTASDLQTSDDDRDDIGSDTADGHDNDLTDQLHASLHEATSRCAELVDKLHAIVTTDGQLPLL